MWINDDFTYSLTPVWGFDTFRYSSPPGCTETDKFGTHDVHMQFSEEFLMAPNFDVASSTSASTDLGDIITIGGVNISTSNVIGDATLTNLNLNQFHFGTDVLQTDVTVKCVPYNGPTRINQGPSATLEIPPYQLQVLKQIMDEANLQTLEIITVGRDSNTNPTQYNIIISAGSFCSSTVKTSFETIAQNYLNLGLITTFLTPGFTATAGDESYIAHGYGLVIPVPDVVKDGKLCTISASGVTSFPFECRVVGNAMFAGLDLSNNESITIPKDTTIIIQNDNQVSASSPSMMALQPTSLNIASGSKIIIEDGGQLIITQTTDVVIPKNSSPLTCSDDSSCYMPFEKHVSLDNQVTWKNYDVAFHTVTSGNPSSGTDGKFDSTLLSDGDTFSHTFSEQGVFDYFCTIHPWQRGVIVVN